MSAIDIFKTLLASDTPPTDDQITALLAEADFLILGFTFLPGVPAELDDVRAYMALVQYNRAGAEGEIRRVEGGMTSVYEPIPESVKVMLRPYRRARAVMS